MGNMLCIDAAWGTSAKSYAAHSSLLLPSNMLSNLPEVTRKTELPTLCIRLRFPR